MKEDAAKGTAGGRLGSKTTLSELPENFFYDKVAYDGSEDTIKHMAQNSLTLFCSFGFDSHKRSNLHYLDETTLLSAIGNILVFFNLKTMDQVYFPGLKPGAVGAVTVHPSKKYIAVAEVFPSDPVIYIFEYPSLKLYRMLRGGTTRGYSDLCFNSSGDLIASVGCDPDYMLTIWNWKSEAVILRSKAFSQDVYKVSFAPDSDGNLTTSGMGHIKFWQMSATFTGLKLQGYIGKFGASELTDISAFIQFPDGKVLSSTETGNMLLWDGGMIKCEISGKGRKPCHQGKVEVIILVEGEVFTAGEDGYVRVWDFETIDTADVTGTAGTSSDGGVQAAAPVSSSGPAQARVFEMEILEEFLIGKDVKIKSMVKCPGDGFEYLIQDLQGHLFKLDTKKRSTEKILSFHSGAIAAIDASPLSHALMSLGTDGTLRLYDHLTKSMVTKVKYPYGGSALVYLPETLDSRGCTVAAGFADGVLRILSHTPVSLSGTVGDFTLHFVLKPHKHPITSIAISEDGTYLATASEDNTVFFFKISPLAVAEDSTTEGGTPIIIFSKKYFSIIPIGFFEFQSQVVSISISPDNHANIAEVEIPNQPMSSIDRDDEEEDSKVEGKRALIVTKEGKITSIIVPTLEAVDSKVTYQLTEDAVNLKKWVLDITNTSPVSSHATKANGSSDIRDEVSTQLSNVVEAGGEAKLEIPRSLSIVRRDRGLAIDNQSPATFVMYLEGGYFLVAFVNKFGEGEIRSCKYGSPNISRLILTHKAPFTDLRLSNSGKYLLAGTADGTTCIRKMKLEDMVLYKWEYGHETYEHYSKKFEKEYDEKKLAKAEVNSDDEIYDSKEDEDYGQYWFGHSHDCDRGRINSVITTFDDSFFCSAGNDGGLYVWRINTEDIKKSEALEYEIDEEGMSPAEDIGDGSVYTIQEEKLKLEKDREINEAELKKQMTRDYIADIRNEFLKTLAEAEKVLGPTVNLNEIKSRVPVDPDLLRDIERETEEKINTVRKELSWISEKESIGPNKLRKKFLDELQTEHIEISSFRGASTVATFRTTKLEQTLESVFQPLLSSDRAAVRQNQINQGRDNAPNVSGKLLQPGTTANDDVRDVTSKKGAKATDARSKLEARKANRAERSALWKSLMDSKPDESYEDPRDVAAIRYAENHMGDYKLKTGEKYIVPESERVDADKKRRQILMLKESIFSLKEQFNNQVIRLRDQKHRLVELFQDQNKKIVENAKDLQRYGEVIRTDSLWNPIMEREAFPELRYVVTHEDIAELQRQEAEALAIAKGTAGDFGMGFGNTGASAPAPSVSVAAATTMSNTVSVNASTNPDGAPASLAAATQLPGQRSRPVSSTSRVTIGDDGTGNFGRSGQELIEFEAQKKTLLFKRERMLKSIADAARDFDENIETLSNERVALEADIKFANIKLLLLYREWVLLKEFEKYDNALAEKLSMKRNEKHDIDMKILECQEKLNSKKLDIEQVIRKEKEILDEFHTAVGDNNKHEEYLSKVFKKKIKRSKKKVKYDGAKDEGEDADDDEEEESDEDDDDDLDDSDGDDSISSGEEGEGQEVCPADCDPGLFAKIQELREKKLDQEDILVEIQKTIETLKKENDGLIKKERIIDAALTNAETEIQDFQTQKQQKLNELDVVIPLRLHQIQHLEKNMMPVELNQSLVFVNNGLYKLRNRIRELQQEKADIRKQHKELKKMHVSLIKNRKEKQQKLSELDSRATDVQMLKFGKIIDLEKLERMGVNRNADELREKLQKEDAKRTREIGKLELDISCAKENLTDVMRENTIRLESLVQLTEARQKLEESLNSSQTSVTAQFSGLQKKDQIEREKLYELVENQAREIEELKREIEVLIQKPVRTVRV